MYGNINNGILNYENLNYGKVETIKSQTIYKISNVFIKL